MYDQTYYQRHKEAIAAYQKAYRGRNRKRLSEYRRAYVALREERKIEGDKLRAWRKNHGYTQAEMARMIGVGQSAISHMELGRAPVSRKVRGAIPEWEAL